MEEKKKPASYWAHVGKIIEEAIYIAVAVIVVVGYLVWHHFG